jgi:hypothetical protein
MPFLPRAKAAQLVPSLIASAGFYVPDTLDVTLLARQTSGTRKISFLERNEVHSSPYLNMRMSFIVLRKGIFLGWEDCHFDC